MRFAIASILALAATAVNMHAIQEAGKPDDKPQGPPKGEHDDIFRRAGRIFEAVDVNEDGEVSRNEFHDAIDQLEDWEVIGAEEAGFAKDIYDEEFPEGETMSKNEGAELLGAILAGEDAEDVTDFLDDVEEAAIEGMVEMNWDFSDTDFTGTVDRAEWEASLGEGKKEGVLDEEEHGFLLNAFDDIAGKDGQMTFDEAIDSARQAMECPEMKERMAHVAHKAWEAMDGVDSVEGDKPEGDKPEGDKPEGDKPSPA